MPKLNKSEFSKDKLVNALQHLYADRDKLTEKIDQLSSELDDMKKILVNILKYQKALNDFESKIFIKNLEK